MTTHDDFWPRQRLLFLFVILILAVGAAPSAYRLLKHAREAGPPQHLHAETVDLRSIDVNGADAAVLETLPGIGPALAARIVEERLRRGPFRDADDLCRVKGIGPAISRKVEPYVFFASREGAGRRSEGEGR